MLVHGLFAHRRIPGMLELAESLTRFGPVWTMDLRGHGTSGGWCTLGDAESLDVGAVTALVRRETSLPVVAIGFSMGAAAVVRSAALVEPVDAAVPVSGAAEWHRRTGSARRGRGSRRTALVWRLPGGTAAAGALTGVRIARQIPTGESPASVIGRIAPAPVLVVHGTKDPFFPVEEARDLYERAGEPKALWVIPGGGHAEGLFTEPGRPVARGAVDGFAEELVGRLAALEGPAKFRV
ncbi:MAG TPA: alpha/beta fold hydrolase [Actinomycetota bacterium]|nr:alpha/beta fold hydrolase [Actinomycetota bacterium]